MSPRYLTLVALLLLAYTRANAQGFPGTFRDDRLTLTLAKGIDGYLGTVRLGAKTFPLRAKLANDTLTGDFNDGTATHPFTATLETDTLVFKTGATTYRLQRQPAPAPANPLDI